MTTVLSRHVDVQAHVALYLQPVHGSCASLYYSSVWCCVVLLVVLIALEGIKFLFIDSLRYYTIRKGEQMLAISTERRRAWLAAISRADLTEDRLHNVYVCSRHFVKG